MLNLKKPAHQRAVFHQNVKGIYSTVCWGWPMGRWEKLALKPYLFFPNQVNKNIVCLKKPMMFHHISRKGDAVSMMCFHQSS